MDGVPVKISEKYKPPPKVTIPYTIVNRLNADGYPPGIFDYDFTLENNVIKSMEEWKKVREINKANRCSRLQQYELEKVRLFEEKQKQMLTSVSYPNADEMSSGDEGDTDSSTTTGNNSSNTTTATPINTESITPERNQVFSMQNFDTILKPTVLPDNTITNQSLENKKITETALISNQSLYNSNLETTNALNTASGNKINYSDFENDTSSPFDNIELKTINDLDILAQVYNISHSNKNVNSNSQTEQLQHKQCNLVKINSKNESENSRITNIQTTSINRSNTNSPIYWNNNINQVLPTQNSITINRTNIPQQNQIQFNIPGTVNQYYNYQQNYANINGSLSNTPINQQQSLVLNKDNYFSNSNHSSGAYGNVPIQNQNYQYSTNYLQQTNAPIQKDNITSKSQLGYSNFQTYANSANFNTSTYASCFQQQPSLTTGANSSPVYQNKCGINIATANANQYQSSNLSQRPYIISSGIPYPINYTLEQGPDGSTEGNLSLDHLKNESAIQSWRNKSKSVPDILKELNMEIKDSELRRARNHSQTLEDYSQKCRKIEQQKLNQDKKLPESFQKLSLSSQNLIKNISLMGFPIERVAKIAEKLGTDDKKIIEHLIPLSELLDLGFDEDKISEALLKYDNNKDKALDFLIS